MIVFDGHREVTAGRQRTTDDGRDLAPLESGGVEPLSVATAAAGRRQVPEPPRRASFRRLPPLNALRTFEAAARHRSFTKAAEELLVTPAAVGQQVRVLEDFVGVPLFRRTSRALVLTEAGAACLPEVREGFERLVAGMARLRREVERG